MLNLNVLLASLLALSSSTAVAVADTAARAPLPSPSRGCLVTTEATTQVFQIHRKSDIVKDFVETNLVIVSNGAWTYTETKNGKVQRTEAGCLPKPELAKLTTSLASATWKTSLAQMRCMAYAADFTEYSAGGKVVLTSRMCDGLILDKATQKAMAEVTAITAKLVPAK